MAGVIYYTYTPGILTHLAPKRMPGLFIALLVSFLRVWATAAKFRVLSEQTVSWLGAFRITLTWDFTSAVTPSTIGGAPMATYAMTKEGLKLGESTAIILYSVLLDQIWFALAIPILLISGIYFEVVPPEAGMIGEASMLILYIFLLSYAGLLAYGVLVNPAAIKKVVKFVFRLPFLNRWEEKISAEAENLESYAHQLRKKPFSFLLKAFLFSTSSWLCRIALPTIVILSLLPAPEILSVLRSLAMNLTFLVVPTPGGSGGVEGLFVLFQGPLLFMSPSEIAMEVRESFIGLSLFLWRVISYYIAIGVGLAATTYYINRQVEEIQNKD
ncbi:MAG: flippase-like domain-containing protein [Balneolaceae bacterium]|nr:flippase-like domain-containing protein [Balneolaceae bacterium]